MAYNLLGILCRSAEEATLAAAKLGSSSEVDRLFVFLQSEPSSESISWMTSQDRSIVLERAIEHQDAEGIGIRAAVLYSSSHYWTLLFCWAADVPSPEGITAAISTLNQNLPVQGNLWGNLRENVVVDGFEAVYRSKSAVQSSGNNDLSEEVEMSFGMRGMPVSRKTLIQIVAETVPMRGVGIHSSVQKSNVFWNDIQNLVNLSASVNQENPSTFVFGHSRSGLNTSEMMRSLPKHSTAVIFAPKSEEHNLASNAINPPYRIVYGKDDIVALLFKIV